MRLQFLVVASHSLPPLFKKKMGNLYRLLHRGRVHHEALYITVNSLELCQYGLPSLFTSTRPGGVKTRWWRTSRQEEGGWQGWGLCCLPLLACLGFLMGRQEGEKGGAEWSEQDCSAASFWSSTGHNYLQQRQDWRKRCAIPALTPFLLALSRWEEGHRASWSGWVGGRSKDDGGVMWGAGCPLSVHCSPLTHC